MTALQRISTADQLFAAGDVGRCELVQGELIMMSPAGPEHGRVANELAYLLTSAAKAQRSGRVFAAETGFLIARNPDTVRAPDVAFISTGRLKEMPRRGFFPGAPDLAAEVLSPGDNISDARAKAAEWIAAGARIALLLDPDAQTIEIYRKGAAMHTASAAEAIDLGDVVPGCRIAVGDVFR